MSNWKLYFVNCPIIISLFWILCSCNEKSTKTNKTEDVLQDTVSTVSIKSDFPKIEPLKSELKRDRIKLGHTINTLANEYLPLLNADGSKLYFSAMDRTGFFDFKLDFTKEKSAGGEDIFYSELKEGVWMDAKPMKEINTNGHEIVSQVFKNNDLLVTANYPEKYGVKENKDVAVQTTDIFLLKKGKGGYQIDHLPEPVNSIYTEADGFMAEDQSYILFVSDRNGNIGEYHKKGWKWNESFWGNTDVYVCIKEGDYWGTPINLGSKINTPYTERTPWLSEDGLTLYLSSNGYVKGKTGLDVYAFKRTDRGNWSNWNGPYEVTDANTLNDDWGYKEYNDGVAYLASTTKLGFKPTQGGVAGDGGVKETNYRPGYELHGLQVAALNSEYETNIYMLRNSSLPTLVINDVFFDFDSYSVKSSFEKYLLLIADQIKQNNTATIEINGYTDDVGKTEYNQQLSLKRAEAISLFLTQNGIKNSIKTNGLGSSKPMYPNTTSENRKKNRRVELFIKNDAHVK
jgi:outer membrane protein OmpA-like peptidoglycan-associated protein